MAEKSNNNNKKKQKKQEVDKTSKEEEEERNDLLDKCNQIFAKIRSDFNLSFPTDSYVQFNRQYAAHMKKEFELFSLCLEEVTETFEADGEKHLSLFLNNVLITIKCMLFTQLRCFLNYLDANIQLNDARGLVNWEDVSRYSRHKLKVVRGTVDDEVIRAQQSNMQGDELTEEMKKRLERDDPFMNPKTSKNEMLEIIEEKRRNLNMVESKAGRVLKKQIEGFRQQLHKEKHFVTEFEEKFLSKVRPVMISPTEVQTQISGMIQEISESLDKNARTKLMKVVEFLFENTKQKVYSKSNNATQTALLGSAIDDTDNKLHKLNRKVYDSDKNVEGLLRQIGIKEKALADLEKKMAVVVKQMKDTPSVGVLQTKIEGLTKQVDTLTADLANTQEDKVYYQNKVMELKQEAAAAAEASLFTADAQREQDDFDLLHKIGQRSLEEDQRIQQMYLDRSANHVKLSPNVIIQINNSNASLKSPTNQKDASLVQDRKSPKGLLNSVVSASHSPTSIQQQQQQQNESSQVNNSQQSMSFLGSNSNFGLEELNESDARDLVGSVSEIRSAAAVDGFQRNSLFSEGTSELNPHADSSEAHVKTKKNKSKKVRSNRSSLDDDSTDGITKKIANSQQQQQQQQLQPSIVEIHDEDSDFDENKQEDDTVIDPKKEEENMGNNIDGDENGRTEEEKKERKKVKKSKVNENNKKSTKLNNAAQEAKKKGVSLNEITSIRVIHPNDGTSSPLAAAGEMDSIDNGGEQKLKQTKSQKKVPSKSNRNSRSQDQGGDALDETSRSSVNVNAKIKSKKVSLSKSKEHSSISQVNVTQHTQQAIEASNNDGNTSLKLIKKRNPRLVPSSMEREKHGTTTMSLGQIGSNTMLNGNGDERSGRYQRKSYLMPSMNSQQQQSQLDGNNSSSENMISIESNFALMKSHPVSTKSTSTQMMLLHSNATDALNSITHGGSLAQAATATGLPHGRITVGAAQARFFRMSQESDLNLMDDQSQQETMFATTAVGGKSRAELSEFVQLFELEDERANASEDAGDTGIAAGGNARHSSMILEVLSNKENPKRREIINAIFAILSDRKIEPNNNNNNNSSMVSTMNGIGNHRQSYEYEQSLIQDSTHILKELNSSQNLDAEGIHSTSLFAALKPAEKSPHEKLAGIKAQEEYGNEVLTKSVRIQPGNTGSQRGILTVGGEGEEGTLLGNNQKIAGSGGSVAVVSSMNKKVPRLSMEKIDSQQYQHASMSLRTEDSIGQQPRRSSSKHNNNNNSPLKGDSISFKQSAFSHLQIEKLLDKAAMGIPTYALTDRRHNKGGVERNYQSQDRSRLNSSLEKQVEDHRTKRIIEQQEIVQDIIRKKNQIAISRFNAELANSIQFGSSMTLQPSLSASQQLLQPLPSTKNISSTDLQKKRQISLWKPKDEFRYIENHNHLITPALPMNSVRKNTNQKKVVQHFTEEEGFARDLFEHLKEKNLDSNRLSELGIKNSRTKSLHSLISNDTVIKSSSRMDSISVGYDEFSESYADLIAQHRKCGALCFHLRKFFEKIEFNIKQYEKKQQGQQQQSQQQSLLQPQGDSRRSSLHNNEKK